MSKLSSNPIYSKAEWRRQRQMAFEDPGGFHGDIAKREIYWFSREQNCWVKQIADLWHGLSNTDGEQEGRFTIFPRLFAVGQ